MMKSDVAGGQSAETTDVLDRNQETVSVRQKEAFGSDLMTVRARASSLRSCRIRAHLAREERRCGLHYTLLVCRPGAGKRKRPPWARSGRRGKPKSAICVSVRVPCDHPPCNPRERRWASSPSPGCALDDEAVRGATRATRMQRME